MSINEINKNKATINDIARLANVSPMTVSRVINDPLKVKEITREKVKAIMKKVNYQPNMLAKSLVKGRTKTVGVLYSNIYNQIYLDIIMGIDNVAYNNDYIIISSNVDKFDAAVKALNRFINNRIDGLIILPMEMTMASSSDYQSAKREMEEFYDYLNDTMKRISIPTVTVYQRIENAYNVEFNFARLAEIALNYLIGKGFKRISMMNSYTREGLWLQKEEVYVQLMRENGLEKYIDIVYEHTTVDGGFIAMNELLKRKPLCEAVFCSNDFMAIGALQALGSAGIKVPDQISVVGNDNAMFCEMTYPKLTSVSLNPYLAGQRAMQMLLSLLRGENPREADYQVEHILIERDSVKKN